MEITESLIKAIEATPTFKTNTHKLANNLIIRDADAEQLLINEVIEHRLPDVEPDKLKALVESNDDRLMWGITYARLNVQKNHWKEVRRHDHDQLTFNEPVGTCDSITEEETAMAIDLSNKIFRNRKTIEFVSYVLHFGQAEAINYFGLTKKQFYERVRWVERYCRTHPNKVDSASKTKRDERLANELELLQGFTILLESQFNSDLAITAYLESLIDADAIQDLVGTKGIQNQSAVIHDFGSNKHDCYIFVNAVYDRIDKIEKELNE